MPQLSFLQQLKNLWTLFTTDLLHCLALHQTGNWNYYMVFGRLVLFVLVNTSDAQIIATISTMFCGNVLLPVILALSARLL